ncbi:DNA translocase FtsK [Actinoallomurus sp. NPDC050550]|uniref:DNA translocase FtsK n=1 Tax=Actinoallomurus sp. NPDC050550 TaxID=3154937 RepID=UPI0033FA8AD4
MVTAQEGAIGGCRVVGSVVKSGTRLQGRYQLKELIGRGGMGEVWRARDLSLSRSVAVKLLPVGFRSDASREARFRHEMKISASLQHPGIAAVYDAGEHDDLLFFIMEYLAGEDLNALLRRKRAGLPVDDVVTLGVQLSDALAAAHEQGIVHRDIKPENIMVLPSGRAKICDFGIARVIEPGGAETGTAGVGTAAYMAPEQFEGRVDERSDLYSLGCVLYETCTGERPFTGSNVELMFKHCEKTPVAPDSIRTDLPAELNDLVLHLLEKGKDDRPQAASQVSELLRTLQRRLEQPAAQVIVAAVSPPHRSDIDVEHQENRAAKRYELPSLAVLGSGSPVRNWTRANENVREAIRGVLGRSGTAARVGGVTRGPVAGLYEVRLEPMTDPGSVLSLAGPISEALGGVDVRAIPSVRSSSPLPGTAAVAFEIPNAYRDTVSLGDVLRSEADESGGNHARVGLGRGYEGPVLIDLGSLPHLLSAGGTHEERSTVLRTVVTSLLMRATPDHLRMVMIDSAKAELSAYEGLPHLVSSVITDPIRGVAMLEWAEKEMDRRYDDLQASDCRTVGDYNEAVGQGRLPVPIERLGGPSLPHPSLVVVIGELADLTAAVRKETEAHLGRLARLARAVDIHLIAATGQTTDRVLTDRIRADIPSRLALRMSDTAGSELMLDEPGAECLLGEGDALFLAKGEHRSRRVQCAQVSDEETAAVVDHWMRQR